MKFKTDSSDGSVYWGSAWPIRLYGDDLDFFYRTVLTVCDEVVIEADGQAFDSFSAFFRRDSDGSFSEFVVEGASGGEPLVELVFTEGGYFCSVAQAATPLLAVLKKIAARLKERRTRLPYQRFQRRKWYDHIPTALWSLALGFSTAFLTDLVRHHESLRYTIPTALLSAFPSALLALTGVARSISPIILRNQPRSAYPSFVVRNRDGLWIAAISSVLSAVLGVALGAFWRS